MFRRFLARRMVRRAIRRTTRRLMRRSVRRLVFGGAVLLLVGATAYKLGQDDVRRVEQQAGKPLEHMNEAELQAAMARAGVQVQEVTPEDEQAMDAADRQEASSGASI